MNNVEKALKRKLNEDSELAHPNFDEMWNRMEQAGHTALTPTGVSDSFTPHQHRNWRKIAIAASLSALLVAVPVYAAIHYNWGNLLHGRSGIETALAQDLGQPLEQSVTKDGIKLTLHTAIVDENRTVILYSLEVGKRADNEFWNVKGVSLKNAVGKSSEGEYSFQQWDEKNQRYNGYFESDWTPQQETENVRLTVDHIELTSVQELDLPLDITSPQKQTFRLDRNGLQDMKVQVFEQGKDKLMLSSAITFDSSIPKEWDNPQIIAYKDGKPVNPQSGGTFGTPGEDGEYTAQQYFTKGDIPEGQTTFKLQYAQTEKSIHEPLNFDLQLSKKKMESGTIKSVLNTPLENGNPNFMLEQMIVTPTQIRVTIRSEKKFAMLPYQKYFLSVNGTTLEGNRWSSPDQDHDLNTIRFERPAHLAITRDTPITFTGKYKVTTHSDDKTPQHLTDISEQKQTITTQIGGYPVKWTYYKQGADLFVETESEDTHFGGINQTHIGLGKERMIGKPITANFAGDGNNKAVDVYKNFKGKEASIYMFYYTTDEPEAETSVPLQPLTSNSQASK
ncbi:DUF4179 domain-containing protein [Paenibacillus sp. P2(2022)]|uniref:DUF4179 domain-containing protein n=1 Tax=Paenibacillus TaxID=44249 RepID=UPI0005EC4174|nr:MULTISPECIES: DUF4179 domain-containing protein [Paenibacillus]AUS29128.1 RNA polymerase sigma factor [Paenibacillus polymyxa]KAE8561152.1 RNA polymerase subunit sigma [Paenibacillus polymyxa]KAF6587116.1 DUF4179 domain-containing protein [Paenibacillus sp. EKM211P]KJK30164.1 RNA polymerase sigma factor [Paenibacillus polymyxa]MCJ1219969.1 DUF4179 domain-containing protein [Paenibacillus polymyxa]